MGEIDELKRLKARFDRIKTQAAIIDSKFEEAKESLKKEFKIDADEVEVVDMEDEVTEQLEEKEEELRKLLEDIATKIESYENAE